MAVETKARAVSIALDYPVDHGGREVSEITLRRPTVREVRELERIGKDAGGDETEKAVQVLALLSGLPPDAIDLLDAADFARASETIAGFFPQAQG